MVFGLRDLKTGLRSSLVSFFLVAFTGVAADDRFSKDHRAPDGLAEVVTSVENTEFLGLGVLRKNTGDPCVSVATRSDKQFWACRGGEVSEKSAFDDIQINLAEKKFVLSRDLSKSADREFDELMMIVDALPKLVTFACYPELSISEVPISVTEDLRLADINYNGRIRKLIMSDRDLVGWELDAHDVYRTLANYCADYYCESAHLRNSSKFWECNSSHLTESLFLQNLGISVVLKQGVFTVTKSHASGFDGLEIETQRFLDDFGGIVGAVACHPESSVVDVPIPQDLAKTRINKTNIRSLGSVSVGSENELTLIIDAYKVYTELREHCWD